MTDKVFELFLWFVFYTIPALYLIWCNYKVDQKDCLAYLLAICPILNIVMFVGVIIHKIKKL